MFRSGGSAAEVDGADMVGSASLISLSPVSLSNVQLEHGINLYVIRILPPTAIPLRKME